MYPTAGGVCRTAGGISSNQEHRMDTASTSRRPAFLCALILLVCALATHPIAEIGMNDDWSYVQSARVLAQTGHIVYNGWSAPILGWQLFWGALFIKLFGPSYTATRSSTLLIAAITAFLTQRTLVRTGISSRNATLGTLALVLSPIFLPLAFSFMTEIDALFCVVLCLYSCLRSLQARTDRAVLLWLAFAALSNAVSGTVRQNVWLGVLVMFPSTLWLLRRRPRVLLTGVLLYAASAVIIYASLHWFAQQPYSVPEHLFEELPDREQLIHVIIELLSLFLSFSMFLLPVLIAFVPAVSLNNHRAAMFLLLIGAVTLGSYFFLFLAHPSRVPSLMAPFKGNYVSKFGLANPFPIKGMTPTVLAAGPRVILTVIVLGSTLCFFAVILTNRRSARPEQSPPHDSVCIPWPALLILLVPFTLTYILLLLPRGLRGEVFDRYCLLMLPVALIFLLRIYQERIGPNLPNLSIALIVLYALYAVAGMHDAFATYRARAAAIDELRAAGIPDTSIDGGFEHNGMVQIEQYGYINDPRIHLRATDQIKQPPAFPAECQPDSSKLTPAIVPGYALSYDANACGGRSSFTPIMYPEWLAFRSVPVYIVNTFRPPSTTGEQTHSIFQSSYSSSGPPTPHIQ